MSWAAAITLGTLLNAQAGAAPAPAPAPTPGAEPPAPEPTPGAEPGPAPAPGAEPGPEPAAPTHATFISAGFQGWDVVVDGQPVCATPCSGPLHPYQFVVLHSQERHPLVVEVGRLPPGAFLVTGKPLESGKYAGGIVATTLGGMALVIGITFTAFGLATDRQGMTTAGLITGAAGAIALPGGIWLMLRAVPRVHVERAEGRTMGLAAGLGGRF